MDDTATSYDLKAGLAELDAEQPDLLEAWSMYEGSAPEVFSSARVARFLRSTSRKFRINWCRTTVTAVLNRLSIAAVQAVSSAEDEEDPLALPTEDTPAQVALDRFWYANRLGLLAVNIHEAALGYGETYAIVWPDTTVENGEPLLHHNPPTQVRIVYDVENPRLKRYAIKRWRLSDKRLRANLYYPDRIERYVTAQPATEESGALTWRPYFDEDAGETEDQWEVDNPYGVVPVFHFRPQWPVARPEHLEAYGAQNGLNKLLNSFYGTVDFQVFPQRYALQDTGAPSAASMADEDFADDEDTDRGRAAERDQPHAGPGTVWWLEKAKAVGTFPAADPKTFWEPIQQLVQNLAVVTDTPLHLYQFGGAPPSGESRRAASEPLYAKVTNRQDALGATWEELFEFALKVAGIAGKVQVDWAPIDRAEDKDALEAAKSKRELGVPDEVVLMELGYTDREMASWAPQPAPAPSDTIDVGPEALPVSDSPGGSST